MLKDFVIERKKLTVENKFSYCPYCKSEFKDTASITYKDVLPKLVFIKKMNEWMGTDNQIHKSVDEVYFCEKCGRKDITTETFIDFYGMKKKEMSDSEAVEEAWKRG